MILAHRSVAGANRLDTCPLAADAPIPSDALWIDLHDPTREEEHRTEERLGIDVPTREDMDEMGFEPSELLYQENGARYMTAQLLVGVEAGAPELTGVTFILKDDVLVTVRYAEPRSFAMFLHRALKPGGCGPTPEAVLAGLVDAVIDRAADVLQATGDQIDRLSRAVFEARVDGAARTSAYQETLRALGRHGDLISKGRESLVSVERVLLFLSASYRAARVPMELREQVRSTLRDLQSLEEQATFQSSKIQFLLDATLGLVTIDQNNIVKLFAVLSVVFMPPTLIASIYGMNFKHMPELEWRFGYPLAILAMIAAGVLPYLFFRWKRWL